MNSLCCLSPLVMEKAARSGTRNSSLHALDDYEVYEADAHRDVVMTPSSRPSAISSGAYDDQRTGSSIYYGDHMSVNENLSLAGSDLHVDSQETETVAGILYKWVNLGKGWRPRWFVLKDGVLKYYKIHGPNKITVCDPMHSVARIIGEESQKFAKKQKSTNRPCKAFGEVHLQVSTIRKSNSDDKKFYIFTGTKTLHLRVESKKDRNIWLEALRVAKMNFQGYFPKRGAMPLSLQMDMSTERLRSRLLQEGLPDTVIGDCEAVVQTEFSSLFRRLRVLEESHINLVERLKQLEGEKMELETTVIDESQEKAHSDEFGEDGGESEVDTEDERELHNGVEGESDEDENAFFDTNEYLSSDSLCHSTCIYNEDSKNSSEGHAEINAGVDDVSIEKVRFDYPFVERRRRLPEPKEKEKGVSLWSMIKDNIGKDLSKICLPVYFNEPLSLLQKCFEDLEYSYLLDRAAVLGKQGDHLQQILHIAAFAVSGYSSTEGRVCKPFNPLLGETYEACYPDKGLRFFSEKVSHHPMTLACHCEGNGWVFWGESTLKSKFWGRSIQLDPVGVLTLQFADGQRFHWSKVTTSIHNLIIGKLYCDHYGTMRIQGGGDLVCKIKFKEQSIMERSPHQVQGYVYNKEGIKLASLFGKWDEAIYYILGDISTRPKNVDPMSEAVLLWRTNERQEFQTRYNLTSFAITLNEITPDLNGRLPPTDSRLRPDQRHLENGEYELANREKLRLEEKQRQARKLQEKGWHPRWFWKNNETQAFEYVGGYWEARESRNWESCPDIFGKERTVEPPD